MVRSLGWVAVKELKLSCHNSETILFTLYIYIHIMVTEKIKFLNRNPVAGATTSSARQVHAAQAVQIWEFLKIGGLIFWVGSLYEGSCHFSSILGVP